MLGMGMCLELRYSQQLELRQSLEMRLEQELIVVQKIKLALNLYHEREDICTRLYKKALRQGKVRRYQGHGMDFEFALVRKRDVPEHIWRSCGMAFSHCLMQPWNFLLGGERYARAKGSWLLFVIFDMYPKMPEKAIEYASVHERGEMVTLGNHNLASKLEFAIAAKEQQLRWYMNWIERTCPHKFADVFSYQTHLELPEGDELRETLATFQSSEEAQHVQRLIENFQWPYTILQRLSRYKKVNDQAAGVITRICHAATESVSAVNRVTETIQTIRRTMTAGLAELGAAEIKKYLSPVRLGDLWQRQIDNLNETFLAALERRRQVITKEAYLAELKEAGCPNSLPKDGVFPLISRRHLLPSSDNIVNGVDVKPRHFIA